MEGGGGGGGCGARDRKGGRAKGWGEMEENPQDTMRRGCVSDVAATVEADTCEKAALGRIGDLERGRGGEGGGRGGEGKGGGRGGSSTLTDAFARLASPRSFPAENPRPCIPFFSWPPPLDFREVILDRKRGGRRLVARSAPGDGIGQVSREGGGGWSVLFVRIRAELANA